MKKIKFFTVIAIISVLFSTFFTGCIMAPEVSASDTLNPYEYGIWENLLVSGVMPDGESVQIFLDATTGETVIYNKPEIDKFMYDKNLTYEEFAYLVKKFPPERSATSVTNVEEKDMPEPEYIGEFAYSGETEALYFSAFDGEDTIYCKVSDLNLQIDLKDEDQYSYVAKNLTKSTEEALEKCKNDASVLLKNKMSDLEDLNRFFGKFSMNYNVEEDKFFVVIQGTSYEVSATNAIIEIDNRIDEAPFNKYLYDYQLNDLLENPDFALPFKKWIEKACAFDKRLIFNTYPKINKFFRELNAVSRRDSDYMVIPCLEYADNYLKNLKIDEDSFDNAKITLEEIKKDELYYFYNVRFTDTSVPFSLQGVIHMGDSSSGYSHLELGINRDGKNLSPKEYGTAPKWFEIAYNNYNRTSYSEYKNVFNLRQDLEELFFYYWAMIQ